MDVETTSERIVPTTYFVSVVHPYMPTSQNMAQIDGSIEFRKSFDVVHEPNELTDKSPIEFIVHGTPNHFIDLQSFMIDVKLTMSKADGSRPADATFDGGNQHFINNLSQSLWSTIKIYLNDVCGI